MICNLICLFLFGFFDFLRFFCQDFGRDLERQNAPQQVSFLGSLYIAKNTHCDIPTDVPDVLLGPLDSEGH